MEDRMKINRSRKQTQKIKHDKQKTNTKGED